MTNDEIIDLFCNRDSLRRQLEDTEVNVMAMQDSMRAASRALENLIVEEQVQLDSYKQLRSKLLIIHQTIIEGL
jgi:hypothetical protein